MTRPAAAAPAPPRPQVRALGGHHPPRRQALQPPRRRRLRDAHRRLWALSHPLRARRRRRRPCPDAVRGHEVVPRAGGPALLSPVLLPRRPLGRGLHPRRNARPPPALLRLQPPRPAPPHIFRHRLAYRGGDGGVPALLAPLPCASHSPRAHVSTVCGGPSRTRLPASTAQPAAPARQLIPPACPARGAWARALPHPAGPLPRCSHTWPLTAQACDLVDSLLVLRPDRRPSCAQALAHPFFSPLHDATDEPEAPASCVVAGEGEVWSEAQIKGKRGESWGPPLAALLQSNSHASPSFCAGQP